ncbi:SH3 domain-containing protein [Siccirubricoccus sp. G192]|uniref:SH3 domain-containing protein n=1 Tax=Siccirubricoccus sp. G192 TaxID=2849651 RepID=UPI001C2C3923|nr:SH3 domain-containing protein [Siccirubricoccus sp. G192]MBV1800051.1 SH3 domain-containing protein [Siccirubricoccus sp. G192]
MADRVAPGAVPVHPMKPLVWGAGGALLGAVLVLVIASSGGSEQAPAPPAAAEIAEQAALRTLRARLREPESASFGAVRVHQFGPADERAVCGQVAARDGPPVDFVIRVILPGTGRPSHGGPPRGGTPLVVMEEGPGLLRSTADAQRRYCHAAPPPAIRAPEAAPAVPDRAPPGMVLVPPMAAKPVMIDASAGSGVAIPASQGNGMAEPQGRAVVQSPANLRAGPGGGAEVLSTLPRGQVLTVFDRAPGGWLRVGEAEPRGWVHSSLLAEGQH